MAHKTLAIIAVLSLVGLLFLVYLAMTFESPDTTRTVEIDQPVPRPAEPVERVITPAEPPAPAQEVELPPLEVVEVEPQPEPEPEVTDEPVEVVEMPPLNNSDSFVLAQIASLETGASLLRMITPEEVVRRFVVYTENVARGTLPQLDYPVQRLEGEMPVQELDDNLYVMDPSAHRRFDRVINTLVAMDVDEAMNIYEAMRPLLEEAYAEIGFRNRSFDEVLIQAIDTVMAVEVPEGPYQLIKPSVMFLYAESSIEDLDPVTKQLIRLGPENTEKLRSVLPQYRERLQANL